MGKTEDFAPTHDSDEARAARRKHQGWGYCYRCGMPWPTIQPHSTQYISPERPDSHRAGCFPLCEDCWALLGHPEARIEYYVMLMDKWDLLGPPVSEDHRRAIAMAVANER